MTEDELARARRMWSWVGVERPAYATPAGPGQESVWDYPRPPRVAADAREVVVRLRCHELARSRRTLRVLETASPPAFYIPLSDVRIEWLEPEGGSSYCEWKGLASYHGVRIGDLHAGAAGWSYADPKRGFESLREHVAFYPSKLECTVAGTRVLPQSGSFYGGWITPELVGPFKGEPGSSGW